MVDRTEMLKRVFAAFDAHAVDWCVLHGYEELPERITSDVDLMVAAKDFARVPAILAAIDGAMLVQALDYRMRSRYFVLANTDSPRAFLQVDVSSDLRAEWCQLIDGAELLAHKRQVRQNLWALPPAQEFAAYLVKKILKHQYLGAEALDTQGTRTLARLYATDPQGCVQQVQHYLAPSDATSIVEALRTAHWQPAIGQLAGMRRRMVRRALARRKTRVIVDAGSELRRRWRRITEPTGLMIAFYGVDGAGKSTLIDELARVLAPAFRRVSRQHWRPNLWALQRGSATPSAPHASAPHSRAVSSLQLLWWWLDYTAGGLALYLMKGYSTLVLFDRYFHDARVDPQRYRSSASLAWLQRVGRSILSPDLSFVIDVPAQLAHSRKPETTLERLALLARKYRELGHELPNTRVIDGTQPLSAVVGDISASVLDALRQRTAARLRLLP